MWVEFHTNSGLTTSRSLENGVCLGGVVLYILKADGKCVFSVVRFSSVVMKSSGRIFFS